MNAYPHDPGFKTPGPSLEAAEGERDNASRLRGLVRSLFANGARLTADECAERLGESVLSVRPRVSELRAKGELADSSERRKNRSGKSATVWRLAEPATLTQPELIAA